MDLHLDRWTDVVKYLKEHDSIVNISRVAKDLDVTYAHMHLTTALLANEGLLTLNKEGRSIIVVLTPKGILVANHLISIRNILLED